MVGIAFVATWVMQAHDLVWPLTSGVPDDQVPAPLAVWAVVRDGGTEAPIGLTGPVPLVVLLLAGAMAAQLLYLDRLSMRVGWRGQYDGDS
jgi:hypothetical protein